MRGIVPGPVTVIFARRTGLPGASMTAWSCSSGAASGTLRRGPMRPVAGKPCAAAAASAGPASEGRKRSCRPATARPRLPQPLTTDPPPLYSLPVARACSRTRSPATPNQNGKVERFHGTFRPGFPGIAGPFTSVAEAQAAVDAWAGHCNADRPHQALDEKVPVTPAERFTPAPQQDRDLVNLWLPATLEAAHTTDAGPAQPRAGSTVAAVSPAATRARWHGGPVEFDRIVPPVGEHAGRWPAVLVGPGPGQ